MKTFRLITSKRIQALNALAEIRDYVREVAPHDYNQLVANFNQVAQQLGTHSPHDWATPLKVCKFCDYSGDGFTECFNGDHPCGNIECPKCASCQGQEPTEELRKTARARREIVEKLVDKLTEPPQAIIGKY